VAIYQQHSHEEQDECRWPGDGLHTGARAAAGIPGDFNQNGIVDAADYVVWLNAVGTIHKMITTFLLLYKTIAGCEKNRRTRIATWRKPCRLWFQFFGTHCDGFGDVKSLGSSRCSPNSLAWGSMGNCNLLVLSSCRFLS
jgi:hypothetical protein